MQDGIHLEPDVLIEVLQNKLSMGAVREAQMEAAIQGLINQIQKLERELHPLVEVSEDASAAESE